MPYPDHVTITATDFHACSAFYDATLPLVGLARIAELVDEEEEQPDVDAVGWGPPDGAVVVWLVRGRPADDRPTSGLPGQLSSRGRGVSPRSVEVGGRSHHAPRRWPLYRTGDFSAIVADPAGNLLEVVGPE